MKKTASEHKGKRGSGKAKNFSPSFNTQNDKRKARTERMIAKRLADSK